MEVNVTVVGVEGQKAGFEELHTAETEIERSDVAVYAEGQVTSIAEMVAGGITVHVIGFEEGHTTKVDSARDAEESEDEATMTGGAES